MRLCKQIKDMYIYMQLHVAQDNICSVMGGVH